MRILLVDDRPEHIYNYSKTIRDYNKDIEVIEVNSFDEMRLKLLTIDFDTAIVDMNLGKWGNIDEFDVGDGKELCDFLVTTKNFKDLKCCLFLYASFQDIKFDVPYSIVDKKQMENIVYVFQTTMLDKMKSKVSIKPSVDLTTFKSYPEAKKISYYKKIIGKDKGQSRFTKVKNNFLWTSDLVRENNDALVCLQPGNKEHRDSTVSAYKELDEVITKNDKAPSIFWNYSEFDLLNDQANYISKTKFENDFIKLFFRISFAHGIASHISEGKKSFTETLDLVERHDQTMQREVQSKIVDIMLANNDNETTIRKELSAVSSVTKYELVEYFEGSLESFNPDTDVAEIRLTSRINPNKYVKRQISYQRLYKNGIKFRHSKFLFYVSEYEGQVIPSIEPQ